MKVEGITLDNNKINKDAKDISNIWFYLIYIMKFAVDTEEALKDGLCSETEYLYDKFEKVKKEWESVNKQLEDCASTADNATITALQGQQNALSIDERDIQSDMKTKWEINVNSITSEENNSLKWGYKALEDMYDNNPATKWNRR